MTSLPTVSHWIGGKPYTEAGSPSSPVYNPALGAQIRQVELGSAATADAAVCAAADAFAEWSQSSLSARSRILFAFRERLAEAMPRLAALISEEHGKTVGDAAGEVQRGLEIVEYACGIASHLRGRFSDQLSTSVDVFSFREPLGVVAGITPFNFPVMVPLWMHPIAIACGNTFILKPSERDPSPSLLLAELWQDAGLPDGVFSVLQGDRAVAERLLDHPEVAAVSFVGSTPVARAVHERAARSGTRVQALGGAKNHAVVMPDADLAVAADHLAEAAYGSAGERCMALSVAVAVGESADRLVELLAERARSVRVGPGTGAETQMGPVITKAAQDRITGIIGRAADAGAEVVVDGREITVDGHNDGFFVGPTVVDRVATDSEVYREEVFGPVLSVVRVADLDEALDVVNANEYGNGAAIFTSSGAAARHFQRRVKAGMVGVNVPIPVPASTYSFGGWKASMFGEHKAYGEAGVAFYTQEKTVTQRWLASAAGTSYSFPGHT